MASDGEFELLNVNELENVVLCSGDIRQSRTGLSFAGAALGIRKLFEAMQDKTFGLF